MSNLKYVDKQWIDRQCKSIEKKKLKLYGHTTNPLYSIKKCIVEIRGDADTMIINYNLYKKLKKEFLG